MKGESRSYHVWSELEEQALREGVRRYGVGSWEPIRQDKSFSILKFCSSKLLFSHSPSGNQVPKRGPVKRQMAQHGEVQKT